MTNAYLLPDLEDDEERASFIRFRAKKLGSSGFQVAKGFMLRAPQWK